MHFLADEMVTVQFVNLTLFKVGDSQSYTCTSQSVNATDDSTRGVHNEISFSAIKLDAFRNKTSTDVSYTNGKS